MKILILGDQARYEKYMPVLPFIRQQELVFLDKSSSLDAVLAAAPDAAILFVDAITAVPSEWIQALPQLKMIHSEGVAYDKIDLAAARERGIYVCNNKGCNAGAVAEQAIMLMLMLLRHGRTGDLAVREGRQMEVKERYMQNGIRELSACRVGLVGFGDIARAAAERLVPFGCELYYYTKHRRLPEEEKKYHVTYLPLEELAEKSDIVSLHCAVTEETRNLVDAALLRRMKPTAYLINTARGALVDEEALAQALRGGKLKYACLDVTDPEPPAADSPLRGIPNCIMTPHLAGLANNGKLKIGAHVADEIGRFLTGGTLVSEITQAMLATIA